MAEPLRAHALPKQPLRLDDILRGSGRSLAGVAASSIAFARRGRTGLAGFARRVSPHEIGPKLRRLRDDARALALPYSHDEREALALLFLPFLLVASAIVVHQSVRTLHSYLTAVALPETQIAPVNSGTTIGLPVAAGPTTTIRESAPEVATLTAIQTAPSVRQVPNPSADGLNAAPLDHGLDPVAPSKLQQRPDAQIAVVRPAPAQIAQPPPAKTDLAHLAPAAVLPGSVRPVGPSPIDAYEADDDGNPIFPGICAIDQVSRTVAATPVSRAEPASLSAEDFGLRLAEAAESQVGSFVIYNDTYRSIGYPMGDVPSLFGVCTDVVVRAYRALGVDLQALVHQARSGSGDTSIDHRRTEVLRRFFGAHGESLPITSFAEDYRPGDILTYYRPQNRRTRAHIAVVSSVIAPSGRPMIVHNRGWGPQLEDALFVDEITGHYRYRGPTPTRNALQSDKAKAAPHARRPAGTALTVVPASLRNGLSETHPLPVGQSKPSGN